MLTILRLISSKHRPVASFNPKVCNTSVQCTSIAILAVHTNKIITIRTILYSTFYPFFTFNLGNCLCYKMCIRDSLNGDGKAEIAVRTSEGTVFGDGTKIGDVNQDGITDYVDRAPQSATYGRIITGPEFLSIIEGRTGKEVARTDYIYRGEKNKWVTYWGCLLYTCIYKCDSVKLLNLHIFSRINIDCIRTWSLYGKRR